MRTPLLVIGSFLSLAHAGQPALRPPPLAVEPCATPASLGAQLEAAGICPAQEFERACRDRAALEALGMQEAGDCSGFLFPGQYELAPATPATTVLAAMAGRYRQHVTPPLLAAAQAVALSERQLVSLAALIEAEARPRPGLPRGDYSQLAAVLRNRLARGWPLRSQAALDLVTPPGPADGSSLVVARHLRPHPANTFTRHGLPEQAVCAPGPAALQAALGPAASDRTALFSLGAGPDRFALVDAALKALRPRSDPPPEALTRDTHYLVSDEKRHGFYRQEIAELGGVYIGVGTDQNFALAGWARPELLLIVDFDQLVIDLHKVYAVAFHLAETPRDFYEFWTRDERGDTRAAIAAFYADHPATRKAALDAFYQARQAVVYNLELRSARYAELGHASFLDDPEQYAWVRELFRAGRVYAVRGDFTAQRTMRDLGRALVGLDWPVSLLYLSNCEQYFPWDEQYRRNMLGLPSTPASLVLRTRPIGQDYTYVVQSLDNFKLWLKDKKVTKMQQMVTRGELDPACPLHRITSPPSLQRRFPPACALRPRG